MLLLIFVLVVVYVVVENIWYWTYGRRKIRREIDELYASCEVPSYLRLLKYENEQAEKQRKQKIKEMLNGLEKPT